MDRDVSVLDDSTIDGILSGKRIYELSADATGFR